MRRSPGRAKLARRRRAGPRAGGSAIQVERQAVQTWKPTAESIARVRWWNRRRSGRAAGHSIVCARRCSQGCGTEAAACRLVPAVLSAHRAPPPDRPRASCRSNRRSGQRVPSPTGTMPRSRGCRARSRRAGYCILLPFRRRKEASGLGAGHGSGGLQDEGLRLDAFGLFRDRRSSSSWARPHVAQTHIARG